jgi:hypothetical protein
MRTAQVLNGSEINLIFAEIVGNLDISGSEVPSLDLTGTRIQGEFRLGSEMHSPVRWHDAAKLILRNTKIAALQDLPGAWPGEMVLDGFTYDRLGGLGTGRTNEMAGRDASWFIEWLAKQKSYSPQPYEQLASILQKEGYRETARKILYESRNRESKEKAAGWYWLWLSILWLFIGYGYYPFHFVLWWVLIFTVLGATMLRISKDNPFANVGSSIPFWMERVLPISVSCFLDRSLPLMAYSLDKFLPIVRLRDYHYTRIDLRGWVLYYFYIHQLMGYILASLFIVGLSGLITK